MGWEISAVTVMFCLFLVVFSLVGLTISVSTCLMSLQINLKNNLSECELWSRSAAKTWKKHPEQQNDCPRLTVSRFSKYYSLCRSQKDRNRFNSVFSIVSGFQDLKLVVSSWLLQCIKGKLNSAISRGCTQQSMCLYYLFDSALWTIFNIIPS